MPQTLCRVSFLKSFFFLPLADVAVQQEVPEALEPLPDAPLTFPLGFVSLDLCPSIKGRGEIQRKGRVRKGSIRNKDIQKRRGKT